MAKIKINGDTSGYVELSAPDVAGSTELTLPASTGTLLTQEGGKILQVVSATSQTSTSTSSTSFQDTNLSASITPSANTSKILILVTQYIDASSSSNDRVFTAHRLMRDSTDIFGNSTTFSSVGSLVDSASSGIYALAYVYAVAHIDSPATTSSITYKPQMRCVTASSVVAQPNSITSSIVLLEVSA